MSGLIFQIVLFSSSLGIGLNCIFGIHSNVNLLGIVGELGCGWYEQWYTQGNLNHA